MKSQIPVRHMSKPKPHSVLLWLILVCLLVGSPLYTANALEPLDPNEPPVAPPPDEIQLQPRRLPAIIDFESRIFLPFVIRFSTFAVSPQNRTESLSFYQQEYKMTGAPTPDWTGSQAACDQLD